MFKQIKISTQISLLVGLLAAALVALTVLGLNGQQQAVKGLDSVYQDRVVPLHQLESIVEQYAVSVVDSSHKVNAGTLSWSRGRTNMANALTETASDWQAFLGTDLVADEERLVAAVSPRLEAANQGIQELQQIMQREDKAALEAFVSNRLYPLIDPISEGFQDLMTVQVEVAKATYEDASAAYQRSRTLLITALVVVLVGSLLLAWLIIAGINRQLGAEPYQVAEIAKRVADQDLSLEIQTKSNDDSSVLVAMKRMVMHLASVIAEVRQSSAAIHLGASEIAAGNADLSSRTEQQASALEETASSMEELTATVKQNADNARQASGLALEASATAERGGEVVDRVVKTMHGISNSSQQIAEITNVIDSIAFQTNILALNASVEAARAGEQGRGFAVVAGEVRNLASRSAEAAKEIKELIEGAVSQIQAGSSLAENAGTTMEEVVGAVRRVTDIMDEISAASQEQSQGIDQVSQAVGQMDEVTQQNAALVQEASAAAASLEEQASRMEQAISRFRLEKTASPARALPSKGHSNSAQPQARQAALPASYRLESSDKSEPPQRQTATAEDEWEAF
ncbi:MAG: methyl-accepting chemotaxis protein [Lamprobacter sp.]|uniref:methyl-accepting chemotaxis protein n=1 Tax=Lamprobacter sp. TaxID=3100796 RepID=UPI002B25CA9D|nr:methyl-accepting chemotaxis protein [Lamprobacter sp.]MEA3639782.1 methyl-accepting chemotaxis protein [Lamprobacter sp.]